MVGAPDNPLLSADRLGIRGLSNFSAFFGHAGMETFTCTLCGDIKTDMGAALDHQQNLFPLLCERERRTVGRLALCTTPLR